jgi:hypothetical protein
MDGVFACPKCGYELKSKGLNAGRRVRCDWCESWVEVPFLPRVVPRHRRKRAMRWVYRAWAGVAILAVILLPLSASKWMHARDRLARE